MPYRPILCVDFDGVIHSYTSGWKAIDVIADPPVPGAIQFLFDATAVFRVAIYSSRSADPAGLEAMKNYIYDHMVLRGPGVDFSLAKHVFGLLEWPTEKPAAKVSLDDRAVTFTGEFPRIADLFAFEPWNKRHVHA